MAKREIKTILCSNCLESFPEKELYTVARKINREIGKEANEYYVPYCKSCLQDKKSYLNITKEPKPSKTKKK